MSRVVVPLLPASLVVYAALALASGRYVSGLAAPVVAWLLWTRHRRARFSAYVLLSAVAARAVMAGPWWLVLYAAVAIAALQLPAAREAWPRLRPGFTPRAGDRMSRP